MNTLHRCRGAATVATTALLPGTLEVWDDSDVEGLLSVLFHTLSSSGVSDKTATALAYLPVDGQIRLSLAVVVAR
jgi:hypothetical protein